jgi:PAS domain S-box-containing protein
LRLTNPAAKRIWGSIEEISKKDATGYKAWWIHTGAPAAPSEWSAYQVLQTALPIHDQELEIETVAGERKFILNSVVPLWDGDGSLLGSIAVNQDISARIEAERALRASEQVLRSIFAHVPDIIAITTPDGVIQRINRPIGTGKIEDQIGAHLLALAQPADRARFSALMQQTAEEGVTAGFEYHTSDGIWWSTRLVAMPKEDGQPAQLLAIVADITARKQMEIELLEVKRRLAESSETERIYLAQELHDLPIQELFGAQFALSGLRQLLNPDEVMQDFIERIASHISTANRQLRELCSELRPPMLQGFGLAVAIRGYAEEFERRNPELTLHLALANRDYHLPQWKELALLRICQQALVNVAQHAAAANVYIYLDMDSEAIYLEIRDDGKGFSVPARWVEFARENHLGLVGSAERAEIIGGKYEVISAPGAGASVQVTLPLEEDGSE